MSCEENDLPNLQDLEKWYQNLEDRNWSERVQVVGKEWVYPDVHRSGAAKMYRRNAEGCRDVWKSYYRQRKAHNDK